ncbi:MULTISPECIES: YigZ family protein [unclassified Planococcus (in: firmicutes)]|uniref:YigZ family protein n=1 Tax=Planococcus TaxID=1372 RepID=UPI000C33F3F3|nr:MULTISPECIES: YigZ family protein [unclassified Planococcus (in: firmicutes)]AUD14301.1 YigZ family protein [Planococcus sp. MB-3u-03]PKG48346.1 YigZ family protein [Planococcus sp. Urea-trap-24]PKG92193.1 YigZ family protein [Planococcus sp. Urea-3u-39]PKH42901.1 YigZ family protein [Planococcus sp. MB-3u-09]
MRENYITVGSSTNAEILINKSRFIGHAARAETEAEAIAFIDSIKTKHRQATHNCSAYIIGEHDSIQKANDDGEPSGTAGVPMLEVLKKQGLKDTVLVVTRYYGGIKLGGGGLIRAYGKSASEAIAASGVVERRLHHLMKVSIDYTWLGKMENEIRQSDYPLAGIDYSDAVVLSIHVPVEKEQQFIDWINELTNGQAEIESAHSEFLEFPHA